MEAITTDSIWFEHYKYVIRLMDAINNKCKTNLTNKTIDDPL